VVGESEGEEIEIRPLSTIIVKAALQDDEKITVRPIDEAALLRDSPGPPSRQIALQRLGPAGS
jgi:hypothetical protein